MNAVKKVTTTKKTKIVGTQKYLNQDTGEIIECQVMEIEERDANFQKFWLSHIMSAIDELSNAKMKLVFYIFENINPATNILLKTIDEMAQETKISQRTIIDTLKILQKHDIISRKIGAIILNPNVLFKGDTNKRRAILTFYSDSKSRVLPLAKKILEDDD